MLVYLQMIDSEPEKSIFEQIYLTYGGLMLYVARRILGSQQDAEDAVHQAFVSIAKNMDKISDPMCTKTRSWVVTIAEHKAIDIYRARQRRATVPLGEETAGLSFDMPAGGLAAAISRLPARYRTFILLKYDNGYTNEELAHMLGLSYEGVHSLDARAKKKLKKLLKEEGIDV